MDKTLRGSVSGAIATLLYITTDLIFFITGISPFSVVHYGAVLITPPGTPPTGVSLVLGFIAVMTAGSLVGTAISIIIRLTGIDYIFFKSLGFLLVLWIVHVSIMPRVIEPELFSVLPIPTIISNLLIKIIWATSFPLIYLRLAKWLGKNKAKDKSKSNKQVNPYNYLANTEKHRTSIFRKTKRLFFRKKYRPNT